MDPFNDDFFSGGFNSGFFSGNHEDFFSTFNDHDFPHGLSFSPFFGGVLDNLFDFLDLATVSPSRESLQHPEDLQSSRLHAATLRRTRTLQQGYTSTMKLIEEELGGMGIYRHLISSRAIRTIFTKHAKVSIQAKKLALFKDNILRAIVETSFGNRAPWVETVLLGLHIATELLLIARQHALLVGGACDLIVAITRYNRVKRKPLVKKPTIRRSSLKNKSNELWAKIRNSIGILHRALGPHLTCGQTHIRKKAQRAMIGVLSNPEYNLGIRFKHIVKTQKLLLDYRKKSKMKRSLPAAANGQLGRTSNQTETEQTELGGHTVEETDDINEDKVYDALQALWVGRLLKKLFRTWPIDVCGLIASFFDESLAMEIIT